MATLYQLENIRKEFQLGDMQVPALAGIQLTINAGEFVALRGPSGCGKSTLLNVLGLLEVPSSGQMSFDGQPLEDVGELALTEIRRRAVGFIFQSYNLLPILSAFENVAYPLQLSREYSKGQIFELTEQILADVGLASYSHHKPKELSGGQRQRVAIARALVKKPRVILADEPTANLDSKNALQILELIKSMKDKYGTTVIMATHDTSVAAIAQRSVFIRDGVVVEGAH